MTYKRQAIAHEPLAAALAASNVGTWEWQIEPDRMVACTKTAALFGIAPVEATEGLPVERYLSAIHADDRERLRGTLSEMRHSGGLFVAEYRTIPSPDSSRWVLARGRFESAGPGRGMQARGIVIDVSESHQDGIIGGDPFFARDPGEGSALDRLIARAIEMHELAASLDPVRRKRVKPALDVLLLVLGQQIRDSLPDLPTGSRRPFH